MDPQAVEIGDYDEGRGLDSNRMFQSIGYDDVMSHVKRNSGKCVAYSWAITLVFVAAMLIVSIISAVGNSQSESIGSDAAAFSSIWILFTLVAVSICGTIILKKYHTPLAIGVLLGLTSMMSQLLFVIFAVFVALAQEDGSDKSNDRAMASFMFILFFLFLVFSIILAKFRMTVIDLQ